MCLYLKPGGGESQGYESSAYGILMMDSGIAALAGLL